MTGTEYVFVVISVCFIYKNCDVMVGSEELMDKVKCTIVPALRLCTGRTAHRGSRGIALLYRH
jgi:hypothetical protein